MAPGMKLGKGENGDSRAQKASPGDLAGPMSGRLFHAEQHAANGRSESRLAFKFGHISLTLTFESDRLLRSSLDGAENVMDMRPQLSTDEQRVAGFRRTWDVLQCLLRLQRI